MHGLDLHSMLDMELRRPMRCCTTHGSQHLREHNIICAFLFFFIALALINSIQNDPLQGLSAFLSIVMDQLLLAQNTTMQAGFSHCKQVINIRIAHGC